MRASVLPLVLVTGLLSATAAAQDFPSDRDHNWHQWRGPRANGFVPQGDPPVEWDATKNILWKAEIPGEGNSTPIIWGDKLFLLTSVKTGGNPQSQPPAAQGGPRAGGPPPGGPRRDGQRPGGPRRGPDGTGPGGRGPGGPGGSGGGPSTEPAPSAPVQFTVLCIDRHTGKTLWQKVAREEVPHEGLHLDNTYASGSPVTDGRSLFASFGSRGIYCYDLDGRFRWSKDLGDMQTRNGFGEGASPALHEDTLIVNWDHEGPSFVVALDTANGDERWRVERDEPSAWTTPLVVEHQGRTQVVINGSNRVRSYDFETGKLIWECGGQVGNITPSPVVYEDLVICMSGFRGNASYAIRLDAMGDVTGTDSVVWSHNRGTPYIPSPLLYDNQLYFTQSNEGVLTSLDARTGETLIDRTRLPDTQGYYSSPVGVAGRVYMASRNGTTLVLKHQPKFEVLATNVLDDSFDASPAVVGDRLYLRGQQTLYCIGEE